MYRVLHFSYWLKNFKGRGRMISKIRNKIFNWFLDKFYVELSDHFFQEFDEQEAEQCRKYTDRLLGKIAAYIQSDEPVYLICSKEFAENTFGIQFGNPDPKIYNGDYAEDEFYFKEETPNHLQLVEDENE